jgi:hypothetical protein
MKVERHGGSLARQIRRKKRCGSKRINIFLTRATPAYDSADCRVARERIHTPSGQIVIRSRRVCD